MILYGYPLSSASYRVRIALALKNLPYESITKDLRAGEHREADYLDINSQGFVPSLKLDEGTVLGQSAAIIEYLDETYPDPPLLPAEPRARARVRSLSQAITSDIHPLNNLRVQKALRDQFSATPDQIQAWIARWITDGFAALEQMIGAHGGKFAFGDQPSQADCVLVPQVYAAERFAVDLAPFNQIRRVADAAMALEPVAAAHPSRQPDADAP